MKLLLPSQTDFADIKEKNVQVFTIKTIDHHLHLSRDLFSLYIGFRKDTP